MLHVRGMHVWFFFLLFELLQDYVEELLSHLYDWKLSEDIFVIGMGH